jgi:hypothetical protein
MHGREQHALSGLEVGDILADFDNFAGGVSAQDMGQVHTGQSLAHPYVEVVQSARTHPYEDLILAWLGIGDVFIDQNFWSTELMNANGLHGAPGAWTIGILTLQASTNRIRSA